MSSDKLAATFGVRRYSLLRELRKLREINSRLPFADPIMPSPGIVQFKAEFWPPELYEYNELNVPVGRVGGVF